MMRTLAEFTIALVATVAVTYLAAPEILREAMRGILQQLT